MAESVEDSTPSRPPTPPAIPTVPPPSEVNIEYSGLNPTISQGRDNYFPSRYQSFQQRQDSPPASSHSTQAPNNEQVNSAANTSSGEATSSRYRNNLENFPQSTATTNDRDVRQPGATEALRAKLAEHRKSMSAAYSDENPSRVRDFAFDDGSDKNTSPTPAALLARNATFDQTLSQQNANRPVEAGHRLLQKSHSITAPQMHVPIDLPAGTFASTDPLPPANNEVEGPAIPTVSEQYRAKRRIPNIVTAVDPSASKSVDKEGQPIPKSEIQEAVNNPKKPFYKRGFGTRRRLLGAVGSTSQAGSSMSMNPLSAGSSSGAAPVSAGSTASKTATGQPGFNLGGAARKPSMARRRTTKQAAPVGIAVPNTQRKREPTWSKKARERPLYSLGKPLPTHEEVQAQRAWQEQIERIKEMYPDAEPPEPPPLPSQQGTMGGMQVDKAQLKDIIRSAIMEYKKYEAGELDLDAVSALSPANGSMSSTARRRRGTVRSNESSISPRRRTFGSMNADPLGLGMSRMDSAVIEEEDGPPLEPLYPSTSSRSMSNAPTTGNCKASKADSTSTGRGLPAIAQRDGKEPHRNSAIVRGQRQGHGSSSSIARGGRQSMSVQPDAGMPANTEEPLTAEDVQVRNEDDPAKEPKGEQGNPRDSVYSRDHETEGNWSEEEATELDPDEAAESREEATNEQDEEYVEGHEEDDDYPNILAKWKVYAREPFAEFLGAFVLAVIGVGASAQAALSSNPNIQPTGTGSASTSVNLSAPMAWGAGVAMSVYIAGGISGGHISPAITIVLAVFRGFRKQNFLPCVIWSQS